MIRRLAWLLAAIALLGGAGFWYARQQIAPAISSVVASSLESLHEQNRLTAFAARFVTVVTSRKGLYGLNAEKTLIVPGMQFHMRGTPLAGIDRVLPGQLVTLGESILAVLSAILFQRGKWKSVKV